MSSTVVRLFHPPTPCIVRRRHTPENILTLASLRADRQHNPSNSDQAAKCVSHSRTAKHRSFGRSAQVIWERIIWPAECYASQFYFNCSMILISMTHGVKRHQVNKGTSSAVEVEERPAGKVDLQYLNLFHSYGFRGFRQRPRLMNVLVSEMLTHCSHLQWYKSEISCACVAKHSSFKPVRTQHNRAPMPLFFSRHCRSNHVKRYNEAYVLLPAAGATSTTIKRQCQ